MRGLYGASPERGPPAQQSVARSARASRQAGAEAVSPARSIRVRARHPSWPKGAGEGGRLRTGRNPHPPRFTRGDPSRPGQIAGTSLVGPFTRDVPPLPRRHRAWPGDLDGVRRGASRIGMAGTSPAMTMKIGWRHSLLIMHSTFPLPTALGCCRDWLLSVASRERPTRDGEGQRWGVLAPRSVVVALIPPSPTLPHKGEGTRASP